MAEPPVNQSATERLGTRPFVVRSLKWCLVSLFSRLVES
jgi:hypothetical protein